MFPVPAPSQRTACRNIKSTCPAHTLNKVATTAHSPQQELRNTRGDILQTTTPDEVATPSVKQPPHQEGHTRRLRITGDVAGAISGGLTLASLAVRMVHDLVRDAISDIIGKIASKVTIGVLTAGLAAPWAVSSVAADVTSWTTRLAKEVTDVVTSAKNLKNLLDKASTLLDDVGEKFAGMAAMALGHGSKNADNAAKGVDGAVPPNKGGGDGGGIPPGKGETPPDPNKGGAGATNSTKPTPNKNGDKARQEGPFPDVQSVRGRPADDALDIIPDNWIVDTPRKEPDGIRFRNPHRNGEQIIYEPGKPWTKDPLHSGPYIRVSEGGKLYRIPLEGNPAL
nr:hypothetical protein [uncultured Actinomyces sp.]